MSNSKENFHQEPENVDTERVDTIRTTDDKSPSEQLLEIIDSLPWLQEIIERHSK